jgi:hypothetical protein
MSKANFQQRRRELTKQHQTITYRIEQLGFPRNADERELSVRLDKEEGRLWNLIRDLEDATLVKPLRSRHAIVTMLEIIRDRDGLALPLSEYINELIAKIEEWRRTEPVIWPSTGRVNA